MKASFAKCSPGLHAVSLYYNKFGRYLPPKGIKIASIFGVVAEKSGELLGIVMVIKFTASFGQPTSLCSEGNSLHVSDTGVGALKQITPTGPRTGFLDNVGILYTAHGINSSRTSIEAGVASLEKATAYFDKAIEEAKKYSGGR